MIGVLITAIALVLILEGLAFALAPSHVEEALRALLNLRKNAKQKLGVYAVLLGVVLMVLAASLS